MIASPIVTLAHLSDLHLRRGHRGRARTLRRALELPDVTKADLVVITGDITESGLAYELQMAEELWAEVARQGRLLVVPGNHDTSLHGLNAGTLVNRLSGARRELSERFATRSVCGDHARRLGVHGTPWPVRVDLAGGRCVVYGLDSTRASLGDLLARGRCGARQLADLDEDVDGLDPKTRVVLALHHHVLRQRSGRRAFDFDPALELLDKRALQTLLRRYRVDVVLHGHRHRFRQRRFRDTLVIGGPSTTQGCAESGERFVIMVGLDLATGETEVWRRAFDGGADE